jgi:hypothetical protein
VVRVGGREFSDEILKRIAETMRGDPAISRRQLSLRVCEWMGWRNGNGRLQVMSCRKSLVELSRRGVIGLPACTKWYAFQQPRQSVCPAVAAVECGLEELGRIEILRVHGSEMSALWRGMLDAHHYLGSGPLCGAQLRYLIRSDGYGWLGGLSYSACALRVESRDRWTGWSVAARQRNHRLVVNNSRFLIAPTVKVKCLASWVLSRMEARLVQDWEQIYGYRPVLLETYVERHRFAGTCYRAANWTWVGTSNGQGRHGKGATIKDVYVRALETNWQQSLCREADGQVRVVGTAKSSEPRDWIESELGGADMGDARLTARLLEITGQFYDKPTANIPQACGSAYEAKATYRFLDNEKVEWAAILAPHYAATEARIGQHRLVLAAQDTTTLNYNTHPHTEGLGPIGDSNHPVRGLIVHDTMTFSSDGVPLGLLDLQCWARSGLGSSAQRGQKPIEEKESFKWVQSYRAVSQVQNRCRKTMLVVVADREADIHEIFSEQAATRHGAHLLIRANRSCNRQVLDGDDSHEALWSVLEQQAVIGESELLVPPSEDRKARKAVLAVRSAAVVLKSPKRKPHLAPVPVWAVLAQEMNAAEGVEPLEWMLLTTVEVQHKEQAFQRLSWYARRWGIEVYHRILKSGCCVEERQLENSHRLMNCLAIDLIVAWRIFHLVTMGEHTPDVPCTIYFAPSEWRALVTFVTKTKVPPSHPPSLNEAVRMLATLGGHLGRKHDGHPGAEVLWRGMARLADIDAAYQLYSENR